MDWGGAWALGVLTQYFRKRERAEITKIYTEWKGSWRRLFVKVANSGDCPLYISEVTVKGPSIDAPEGVPLHPLTGSAKDAITPRDARTYQKALTGEADNKRYFGEDGDWPNLYCTDLRGASVIVESNLRVIATKAIPAHVIPTRCDHEPPDVRTDLYRYCWWGISEHKMENHSGLE